MIKKEKKIFIRYWETDKHFDKLTDLINNKYNDDIRYIPLDCFRTTRCIVFEIVNDGEYKRFRYF